MDVLLELVTTGRIGRVRLGMLLSEAEEVLGSGAPHPAIRLLGPEASGYPYYWGDLSLYVSDGRVDRVVLQPSEVIERDVFLEILRRSGTAFEPHPALTFDGQSAIRTDAGAVILFAHREAAEGLDTAGHYLVLARVMEVPAS
ncbi:hypothetical protein [Saccharothrix obliqua]|uniref:hypothetical protein n=1 Tax=Saccharothrix obliqua TaxID=2861747 RepID=UPI001C5ED8F2|nr:hypothetical protein [Saccharothrix obliqua]MBW4721361.1 hypothetical protein [Saccharothrix obliqua]